jgi:uncharacterized protein
MLLSSGLSQFVIEKHPSIRNQDLQHASLQEEAVNRASREFQIFVKPAGAVCNLDCRYCYYRDKSALYPDSGTLQMSEDLLEKYIRQHIEAAAGPEVGFSWHGGEPTTRGLSFFHKAVQLQRKHKPVGWSVRNGIQTNGVLLDENWCRFLSSESFSVGLSLDGPAELHDPYRVTRGGEPTHRQTMRAYDLLRQWKIHTDILCVVHDLNVRSPLTVYRFFREIGCRYLGLLPAVERSTETETGVSPHTPSSEDYGTFLCKIFDEWIGRDVGRMSIQTFEEASRPLMGRDHSLCVFRETCGQIPVLEHNGDFFPCDHFVDCEHRLGNILETPLSQLVDSDRQRQFGEAKRDLLPRYCRECEVLAMCNGGCPKYRFIRTPDGEPGLNYLCKGLKHFFLHSRTPLQSLIARQKNAAPAFRLAPTKAGRNALCPCGSGRKYKKCCGAGF